MTHSDLLAVAAVIFAAVVLLSLLGLCKPFVNGSEGLRKLAHLGTGGLAFLFPWLFSSLPPVLLVCGLALLLLIAVSSIPSVRSRLGGSLYAVERRSRGEFYFPISVALLFALAHGDKLLYLIPLLVLTFADAVASVLGTVYGKVAYEGIGGTKSLEGSVAFFTVAFFAVHVPLLLFTELSRPQSLLVALDIALVVTLLEAVAWRGQDNIIIPLGVFLLLHIYTAMPVRFLIARFIAASVLLVFVMLYRSRTTLQASALLASALVLYASWGVGGWPWLVAPAVLFICYSLFLPGKLPKTVRKDTPYAVTSVASAGLFWLYISALRGNQSQIFPYTVAYTIHLAILGWTLRCLIVPEQSALRRGPILVIQCWLLMFVPYLCMQPFSSATLWQAALALPACGLAFGIFCFFEPRYQGLYEVNGWRWVRQAVLVFVLTAPLSLFGGAQ
jgi:phytol kinase